MFKHDYISKQINRSRGLIDVYQLILLSEEEYDWFNRCCSEIAARGNDAEKLSYYNLLKQAATTSNEIERPNEGLFKAILARYISLIVLPEFR